MSAPQPITRLLPDSSQGDELALEQLTPLVYDELHKLAASYLRGEARAYAAADRARARSLLAHGRPKPADLAEPVALFRRRGLMRLILMDHARKSRAGKRGGAANKVELMEAMAASPVRARRRGCAG